MRLYLIRQTTIAFLSLGMIIPLGINQNRQAAIGSDHPVSIKSGLVSTAPSTCPATLESLVTKLLHDLPSYANRVRIRAGLERNYVLFAGKPDFQPLPLSPNPESPEVKTQQIFFTTVIRRYNRDRIVYHQEHHRLFLTPDASGWRFVMMYSILAPYPSTQTPPLPPRNSSEGSIAQAIRDWLNDCRAGNIQSSKP